MYCVHRFLLSLLHVIHLYNLYELQKQCPLLGGLEMNCLQVSSSSGGWLLEDPFLDRRNFLVVGTAGIGTVAGICPSHSHFLERSSLEKTVSV